MSVVLANFKLKIWQGKFARERARDEATKPCECGHDKKVHTRSKGCAVRSCGCKERR